MHAPRSSARFPQSGCPTFAASLFLPLRWDTNTYGLLHFLLTLLTIRILGTAFAALLGLAFGSFLNVCLSRWPAGESIATPRSHCMSCGRTLNWWENIPLLSWLALRGHCRTCRAWIGWRYPLVEVALAALWAKTAWTFPTNVLDPGLPRVALYDSLLTILGLMVFHWLLVALAVLDAENLWLPNWLTLPGIVAGFLFSSFSFFASVEIDQLTQSRPYQFQYLHGEQWEIARSRVIAILAAALLILLIRWTYKLIRKREGIGLGDAKLMAMLAAWLGLPGTLLSFFIGVALGSVVALIVLANPASRAKESNWALTKLPLGTFLCIGGIISALYGEPILAAYLSWAAF
jgi:leader peptidase (prepilin peptidase)/N-methyltransferase